MFSNIIQQQEGISRMSSSPEMLLVPYFSSSESDENQAQPMSMLDRQKHVVSQQYEGTKLEADLNQFMISDSGSSMSIIDYDDNMQMPTNSTTLLQNNSSSYLGNDKIKNDLYTNSIIEIVQAKEPAALVDKDLVNLLRFMSRLAKPTPKEIDDRTVSFGELVRQKTLIFDLDETLIHSVHLNKLTQAQIDYLPKEFEVVTKSGDRFAVCVRPYIYECLEKLLQFYEMAVFTAADQEYADLIIDKIDPEKKYFQHRLYRQHCIPRNDVYVKDLTIINDRYLEDLIIVDNSILSFAFQIDNGVPICAFFSGNTLDQEFQYLQAYLEELYWQKDPRVSNRNTFKLTDMQIEYRV